MANRLVTPLFQKGNSLTPEALTPEAMGLPLGPLPQRGEGGRLGSLGFMEDEFLEWLVMLIEGMIFGGLVLACVGGAALVVIYVLKFFN